jgi:hypothetical protein
MKGRIQKSQTQESLAVLAVLCLAAGALVYAAGRPDGSPYLLPAAWANRFDWPWLDTAWGLSLPSFLHAFAFSLLTSLLLRPWHLAAIVGCGFWLVVNVSLEIAQADVIAPWVTQHLPAAFAQWPLLDMVGPYLLNGSFDPLDLGITVFGCGLALALLEDRGSDWQAARIAWRAIAIVIIVAAGLTAIVGSTFVATNADLNRPKPPEPEEPSPEPDAGPDLAALSGETVQLLATAAGSDTPLANARWTQRNGPAVELQDAATASPRLVAPAVSATTELKFEVQDANGGTDLVSVHVSPATSVRLDFEQTPDGSPTALSAPVGDDYAGECVRFSSAIANDTSRDPEYRQLDGSNTGVWDSERRFNPPPETPFHIAVQFTTPVIRVGADVYAEPGSHITMTAQGNDGSELASIASPVSAGCCANKTATLALDGLGEIHQVRFETSSPEATQPIIDNLYFAREEPCVP